MFDAIIERTNIDEKKNALYAEREQRIFLNKRERKELGQNLIRPDFVYEDKVIEFNGTVFHADPEIFEADSQPHPFNNKTAAEIQKNDRLKRKFLENRGFKILIIWEKDYTLDKESIIKQCIGFLNER